MAGSFLSIVSRLQYLLRGFPGGSDGEESALPMQETQIWYPGQEEPLKEEMATHSSILAWWVPWTQNISWLFELKQPPAIRTLSFNFQYKLASSDILLPVSLCRIIN